MGFNTDHRLSCNKEFFKRGIQQQESSCFSWCKKCKPFLCECCICFSVITLNTLLKTIVYCHCYTVIIFYHNFLVDIMSYNVILLMKRTEKYHEFCLEAGVPIKAKCFRFYLSENAALRPGTQLNAMHFRTGQFVDCTAMR